MSESRPGKSDLWVILCIFALAIVVRLVYLYESSDNPAFEIPIVDSESYDKAARSIAAGEGIQPRTFFQPLFYPVFLSIIYSVSGSSIIAAKIVQVILGSVTCVLTYALGCKVLNRQVGVMAALMTALCGPLIFFEAELLASGWAAFWAVSLVWLFVEAGIRRSMLLSFLLGVCGALAILTRPTFAPFFVAGGLWLAIVFYRSASRWQVFAARVLAVLAGFLLVAIPVATVNLRVTGRFGILPSSGGLNLYIGNNPNADETVALRPGVQWCRLLDLPERAGEAGDQWSRQRFFQREVVEYALGDPLGFARGLGDKAIQFVSSREIPRNVDVYVFRQWSGLLRVLSWKAGGLGFPFGVLLPLAVAGLMCYGRRLPAPVLLLLIFYPLSVVLVFVTARYRVPVVPLVSILAAAGVQAVIQVVRSRRRGRLAAMIGVVAGVVLLSSVPGPFPHEASSYGSELYMHVGVNNAQAGSVQDAIANFSKAVQLEPNNADAHYKFGDVLAAHGRRHKAIGHYRKAIEIEPRFADAHVHLGKVLRVQGRPGLAIRHYREALRIYQSRVGEEHLLVATVLESLGFATAENGDYAEAESMLRRSLEIRRAKLPSDHEEIASALTKLAEVRKRAGRLDEAAEALAEALAMRKRLFEPTHPALVDGLHQYALALLNRGRYAEAESLLRESLELRRGKPAADSGQMIETLSLLSVVLAEQGKTAETDMRLREAVEIYRSGALPPGSMERVDAASRLGGCLVRLGRHNDAELLLAESYATLRKILGDRHPRTAEARTRLVRLYEATGRTKEAAALRRDEPAKNDLRQD